MEGWRRQSGARGSAARHCCSHTQQPRDVDRHLDRSINRSIAMAKGKGVQKVKAKRGRGGQKGDGSGSAEARKANAKGFSALLPVGFGKGLGSLGRKTVKSSVSQYEDYHKFEDGKHASNDAMKAKYADMVNKYYDLATSFYEYAWGDCFHFAHRLKGETLRESIKRHEHFLASKLAPCLKPGKGANQRPKVLDVGCGVGGPAREISSFCGVDVYGLNNNAYQVERATKITADKRAAAVAAHDAAPNSVLGSCEFIKGDFMEMPFDDNTFDAVYAIEATCHAPTAEGIYSELFRVVKPGGLVGIYEWCLTEDYDKKDEAHRKLKHQIEIGNGLPDIRTTRQCKAAMAKAGFEVVEDIDLAQCSPVPWFEPLYPSKGYLSSLEALSSFKTSPVGAVVTHSMCWCLESVGIAPKGTTRVSSVLREGAVGLIEGGKRNAFTPMYFLLGRKRK